MPSLENNTDHEIMVYSRSSNNQILFMVIWGCENSDLALEWSALDLTS